MPGGETRHNGHKMNQEAQVQCKENPFPPEDSQAVEQAAGPGGCIGSILAELQAPMGQSPERPGLSSLVTLLQAGNLLRSLLGCIVL